MSPVTALRIVAPNEKPKKKRPKSSAMKTDKKRELVLLLVVNELMEFVEKMELRGPYSRMVHQDVERLLATTDMSAARLKDARTRLRAEGMSSPLLLEDD